jgi:hypothetical protein
MTDIAKIRALAQAIVAEIDQAPAPEPAPEPAPAPAPAPTPPPPMVPAEAVPPPPDIPMAIMTGVLPVGFTGDPANMKVVGRDPLPAGIVATADQLIFESFTGDFHDDRGWDIGNRQVLILSRFGAFGRFVSRDMRQTLIGATANNPGIWIKPGAGFDTMTEASITGCRASMAMKQENGGFAGEVTLCELTGMSQDALKVSGANLVHANRIGLCVHRGGAPHSDTLTCMAAFGPIVFRDNLVEWEYVGQTDQSGINNWVRIESYKAGNLFDDIVIEDNILLHANPTSFAMQVTTKNSPVWVGSVQVRGNRMKKAGGLNKILYADSPRISAWSGNIDLNTGLEIARSAA